MAWKHFEITTRGDGSAHVVVRTDEGSEETIECASVERALTLTGGSRIAAGLTTTVIVDGEEYLSA